MEFDSAYITRVIDLSDERDRYLRRIYAAERAGYERGHVAGYERGYLAAVAEIKAANAGMVRALRDHVTMWGPGGRTRFADPRPGDYLGRAAS